MWDSQDWEGSFRRLAAIAAAFILAVAILAWGPRNTTHIAPNPGPSGTPGSTVLEETPPLAWVPQRDPRYLIRPYYLVPDGKVGHNAFAVIRETMSNAVA